MNKCQTFYLQFVRENQKTERRDCQFATRWPDPPGSLRDAIIIIIKCADDPSPKQSATPQ